MCCMDYSDKTIYIFLVMVLDLYRDKGDTISRLLVLWVTNKEIYGCEFNG